jgi:hypothetical protein
LAFGGDNFIRGVAFAGDDFIRGVAFGGGWLYKSWTTVSPVFDI